MKNPERQPNAVFRFLGTVAQNQPDVLQQLSPRDRYILLAHSDISNTRTLVEMTTIFDASTNTIGRAYKKALTSVYEGANAQIQETYPLEEITESIRIRHAEKTAEDSRTRFLDPEKRPDIIERMSEGHRRSYRNNPELRRKTSLANTGRHYTEERNEKIRTKLKGKKRPPEHLAKLVGKPRPPEVRAKISTTQKQRFQDPEQRRPQGIMLGFKGKKHAPEAKRRMSEAAIRNSVRDDKGRETNEDIALWRYVVGNNLIDSIVSSGFLTLAEITTLREHFEKRHKLKNLTNLLNRFSLAVASLD